MSVADVLFDSDVDFSSFAQDTVIDLTAEIRTSFKNISQQIETLLNNSSGNRKELIGLLGAEKCASKYLNLFTAYDALVRFLKIIKHLRHNTRVQIRKSECQLILKKRQCLQESYGYTSEVT